MTTPRVRSDEPTKQARARRPAPPLVPDEYDLTAQWRTGPATAIIAIEVYGRRSHRDAYIRIIDDAGSMDAGSVAAGGTERAVVTWTDEASAEFDEDWLTEQADTIKERLAHRWGTP